MAPPPSSLSRALKRERVGVRAAPGRDRAISLIVVRGISLLLISDSWSYSAAASPAWARKASGPRAITFSRIQARKESRSRAIVSQAL
jgi:hypothetical protein